MTVNKSFVRREEIRQRARGAAGRVRRHVLLTVAACGGGTASTTSKDGFDQAPQKDGALTVWVDATRMAAAKLYQKQHPDGEDGHRQLRR